MGSARLDSVAKFICEQGDWKISNLQLQKLMFMSQMFYMGEHNGARLVNTTFQAWDNGPVSPELYHKVKAFGAGPVKDVFFDALNFKEDDPRALAMKEVCRTLLGRKPGALIELSHWEQGAWARNYVPRIKGINIPDEHILDEYRERVRRIAAA